MKTLLKTILVGAVLATAGVVLADGAADPVVGTWTLNVAKSNFNPGPAPKSQTRTYSVDSAGVSLEVKGVGADGTATSQESTFKYDGKAYVMKVSAHGKVLTLSTKATDANGKTYDNVAVYDKQ